MNIVILGAGPAGLMAAHAATIANHQVSIMSKKRKSYMRGAQYLHMPIPMVSGTPFTIEYLLEGDIDGYRDKVYRDPRVQVSPESLLGSHNAWDIREAYDHLWEMYKQYIIDEEIDAHFVQAILDHPQAPDLIISSIPAKILCHNPNHMFTQETVWVTEMFRGDTIMDNIVVCSGRRDDPWYRTSRIQGWHNTEYPFDKKPPLSSDKVHEVIKPVATTCDCFGEKVARVGRYGTWTKGVLSHSAFYDTIHALTDTKRLQEQNQ